MSNAYPVAVLLAVGLAIWLQRTVPMPRLYVWLGWGVAGSFALLLAPAVLAAPSVESVSQALLLVVLPLVAVPYQVRMMRYIGAARDPRATARPAAEDGERPRGPGGGRVRARDRRR